MLRIRAIQPSGFRAVRELAHGYQKHTNPKSITSKLKNRPFLRLHTAISTSKAETYVHHSMFVDYDYTKHTNYNPLTIKSWQCRQRTKRSFWNCDMYSPRNETKPEAKATIFPQEALAIWQGLLICFCLEFPAARHRISKQVLALVKTSQVSRLHLFNSLGRDPVLGVSIQHLVRRSPSGWRTSKH